MALVDNAVREKDYQMVIDAIKDAKEDGYTQVFVVIMDDRNQADFFFSGNWMNLGIASAVMQNEFGKYEATR